MTRENNKHIQTMNKIQNEKYLMNYKHELIMQKLKEEQQNINI